MTHDHQKNDLYEWERRHVAPLDKSGDVPFSNLQAVVDYVWEKLGMGYPPKIGKLPKQNKTCWARANRLTIEVPEQGIPTWVLLHEMSHSLTANFEGHSHHHGPEFVRVYIELVCTFFPHANRLLLLASAKAEGVEVGEYRHG